MLGICIHETFFTIKNHDDGDDERNKDGNNYDNTTSGSGSDGPIFDKIMMPYSRGGVLGKNGNRRYGLCAPNIYHFKDVT